MTLLMFIFWGWIISALLLAAVRRARRKAREYMDNLEHNDE